LKTRKKCLLFFARLSTTAAIFSKNIKIKKYA
jgi:hypothetical protein